MDETTTKYRTDRQIQQKQLVATAPTHKLMSTLLPCPTWQIDAEIQPGYIFWRRTDDVLDETMIKYRTDHTDRETADGKAQRYHTVPEINLYTACYAIHDELMPKFNQKKFCDDGRTIYWTKRRRNTAPTNKVNKNSLSLPHHPGNLYISGKHSPISVFIFRFPFPYTKK